MRTNRPSVSMRAVVFRRMAYLAEQTGESRSALVERALDDLLARELEIEPPEGWQPAKGNGRPRSEAKRRRLAALLNFPAGGVVML